MTDAPCPAEPDALRDLWLQDSFVMAIIQDAGALRFDLVAHVREGAPAHRPVREGEWACYRRASVAVLGARRIDWRSLSLRPSVDADGSADLGAFHAWRTEGDAHDISGSFGHVIVEGGEISLSFAPEDR